MIKTRSKERKKLRKLDHNYDWDGSYFITIQTKCEANVFGDIEEGCIILNNYGDIAKQCWEEMKDHFDYVFLDLFVIMPDHIHGILHIVDDRGNAESTLVGDAHVRPLQTDIDRSKMKLPKVIQQYKSSVTRKIRQKSTDQTFKWQRSYHDRILRNENELQKARNYIEVNPSKRVLKSIK